MSIKINIPSNRQSDLGAITEFEFTLTNFERVKEDWQSAGIDLSFVDFDLLETQLINQIYIPSPQIEDKTISLKGGNNTFTEVFTGVFMDTISSVFITSNTDQSGIQANIINQDYFTLEVEITTNAIDQDYALGLVSGNNTFSYTFQVLTVTGTGVAGTSTTDFVSGNTGIWINEGNRPWSFSNSTTPSTGTGPTSGTYAFVEGSGIVPGNTSIFRTSDFAKATQIDFDIHMFGDNMGDLFVQYSPDQGVTWEDLQVFSGNQQLGQGDPFISNTIDLSVYPVSELRFLYTNANTFRSDAAITNIILISE